MHISPSERILFIGDSITDCGRLRDRPEHLGFGYVDYTAARLQSRFADPGLTVRNRGIGGNRVEDLLTRLDTDLIDLQPTVVSILIGINDTWRRYDSRPPQIVESDVFYRRYSQLLSRVRAALKTQIILLEPFLLHVPADRFAWREDLNPKIDAVRKLAVEFETELLPLDGIFAQGATRAPAAFWLPDGVHPSAAGHSLIADAWLAQVKP